MAKYKAKRDSRWKYAVLTNHEFLDGAIVQYDFAKKHYKNNIGKVFLADVKSSKYDDWFHSNNFYSEDYFTNVENLVLVDGNYVRQSKARTIARTVTTSSGKTERIGGANAGFFQMDLPDIQGFIQELDLLDENINKAVRQALHKGADIILAEQRRLAPHNLSYYISKGTIYATKKGVLGIAIGYMSDTFKEDASGFNPGVVGMTYEFGRPGHGVFEPLGIDRSSPTMIQVRNGEKVEVNKGTIQAQPHIRRGFDNVAEQAAQAVIDSISAEIDKFGDN